MHILVIRHPETEANISKLIYGKTESDYSEKGSGSIPWVLQKIGTRKIDAVYTSPMQRTARLAAEIAGRKGCGVSVCHELIEMDFGLFENMTQVEAKERHHEHFESYMADYSNYKIPDGESFRDVYNRLAEFIRPLSAGEGTIVLVTHGMVMKAAIAYLLDLPLDAVWHFSTKPATILEIEYQSNYGVLISLSSPDAELSEANTKGGNSI